MMDDDHSPLALHLVLTCRELEIDELVSFATALHDSLCDELDEGAVDALWGNLWWLVDHWPEHEHEGGVED